MFVDNLSHHARRVRLFMLQAGQDIPTSPMVPPVEVMQLRLRLLWEELKELTAAMGWDVEVDLSCIQKPPVRPADIIEVADGCGDISVVNVGTVLAFGMSDIPILEEIDRTNLAKFGPGGYRDPGGKWIKPPDWQPPELARVLGLQGWKP